MGKRMLKWGGIVVLVLLLVGGYIFFFVVPPVVGAQMNRVIPHEPWPVSDEARELHATLDLADWHSDSLLWDRDILERSDKGHVDVPRLIEGNVAVQVFTAVTKTPKNQNYDENPSDTDNITLLAIASRWPVAAWTSLLERARHQAHKLHAFAERSEGRLTVLASQADLAAFMEFHKSSPDTVAGILGIEGAHCLEGKLENVQVLFDEGYRTLGLVHFFDNEVAASAHGISKGGLTEFGKEVIAEAERLGMIIDLAHSAPQVYDEVLDIATRPVIVSHGGVKGTCDNVRNLGDERLKRIAENGGMVGIGYWDAAICDVNPKGAAKAMRYAADVMGVDHVTLGSDYDGATTVPFDTSELVALTQALMDEGFTDEEIRKIMGGNTLSFLAEHLPEK